MKRGEARGFSLLELSTAMFVLGIGMAGVFVSFYRGIDGIKATQESHIAMRTLENEIEYRRSLPFDEMTAGAEETFLSRTPESDRLVNAARTVTIEAAREGLLSIRVAIRWTGENGRSIEKSLTTFIARTTQ